MFKVIDYIQIN